jgi:hypothetical protein
MLQHRGFPKAARRFFTLAPTADHRSTYMPFGPCFSSAHDDHHLEGV